MLRGLLLSAFVVLWSSSALTAPQATRSALVVTNAVLGAAPTSRNTVAVPKQLFKPAEPIYLSVATDTVDESLLPAVLAVNWTYGHGTQEMAVHSESNEINFGGPHLTLFTISKPDGWPVGDYSVEIFLDGQSVKTMGFTVR